MRNIRRRLEELGFSRNEASVWQATLELGEGDLSAIARKAHVSRTSAYGSVEKLIHRDLMQVYVKKRRKIYTAAFPDGLVSYFQRKAVDAQSIVPMLRLLQGQSPVPQITLHEGLEGVRHVLDHILEYGHAFDAITALDDMTQFAGHRFSDFIQRRIERRLRVRLLTDHSRAAELYARKDSKELRQTRFLPSGFPLHTVNYIAGHHVAFLSIRGKRQMGVLIHDNDISETQQMLFNVAWEAARRPSPAR